jgi:hypothetical protein
MPTDEPRNQGVRAVTPYLIVRDAEKAIAFLQASFGAVELSRIDAARARSVTPNCGSVKGSFSSLTSFPTTRTSLAPSP